MTFWLIIRIARDWAIAILAIRLDTGAAHIDGDHNITITFFAVHSLR